MMVKVCGITRREDAEAAVRAGASAIGFIFYKPSPRYVTPEQARELGQGLAVLKVGVFVDEMPDAIEQTLRAAGLDVAQIYGGAVPTGCRIWEAVRVGGAVAQAAVSSEALFLDSAGNGISFDWKVARGAAEKVIIAGGLDASNVREAIRVAQPWGVDASSRLEISPGIKDHEKMRQFIAAAREIS
jgi:phosphoribosylanthranilate isomerase